MKTLIKKLLHNDQGQTLIEVIIAIGLVVMVLSTLVAGLSLGIANNRYAREAAQAKQYARAGTEWVIAMRQAMGWDGFYATVYKNSQFVDTDSVQKYCFSVLPTTPTDFDTNASYRHQCTSLFTNANDVIYQTIYTRDMVFTMPTGNPNEMTVAVTVSWLDRGKIFTSTSSLTLHKEL